jgi:hypothetical protein
MGDRTSFTDLLRSLPPNIVKNNIYPFAVKVIRDHDELIKETDKYMRKHYRVPIRRSRHLRGGAPRRQQY